MAVIMSLLIMPHRAHFHAFESALQNHSVEPQKRQYASAPQTGHLNILSLRFFSAMTTLK